MHGKVDFVILAAGKSRRMNHSISKQFLELGGKPIINYSLNKAINNKYVNNVYVVLEEDYMQYFDKNILRKFFPNNKINVVLGGENRQDSVKNALMCSVSDYVLIHDSARPFVSDDCINNAITYALKYGASSCYVNVSDTIKINKNNKISALDRDKLLAIQTPQCFKRDKLVKAYDYIKANNLIVTDETSALDLIGESTYFYLGDRFNIKITTREDLYIGESILKMF